MRLQSENGLFPPVMKKLLLNLINLISNTFRITGKAGPYVKIHTQVLVL